jgi:hypothetical protein
MIKSRKMRQAGHVACVEESEIDTKLWSENMKGK